MCNKKLEGYRGVKDVEGEGEDGWGVLMIIVERERERVMMMMLWNVGFDFL